jgi:NADH dehydrogenase/NADH:ubiquinone oxidoreductase subunit G
MEATMADGVAPLGHNNPPDPFAAIKAHVDDLMVEAKNFCDGAAVESQDQADTVARLIEDFRQAAKAADEARKEEARPFDEGKAAVQEKYAALIADTKSQKGAIVRALEALKATLTPWLQARELERQEAARKAQEEAAAKAAEAAAAMRAANPASLDDQEAAAEMVAGAEEAIKAAAALEKARSHAKGDGRAIGLRKTYRPILTDRKAALVHYAATRPDDLVAFLCRLAETDVREGKRSIPGFDVIEETKV